jgi:hypothetical protein
MRSVTLPPSLKSGIWGAVIVTEDRRSVGESRRCEEAGKPTNDDDPNGARRVRHSTPWPTAAL